VGGCVACLLIFSFLWMTTALRGIATAAATASAGRFFSKGQPLPREIERRA
jgi:hypothetical protein